VYDVHDALNFTKTFLVHNLEAAGAGGRPFQSGDSASSTARLHSRITTR
jgi:hypothetical protein